MQEVVEFFVPSRASDLDDATKSHSGQYSIDPPCDFDIPARLQLDDLTRLFDALHREKSPTALFSKPEMFSALYSYVKALQDAEKSGEVTRASRHKICHEVGERMKKLLQVAAAFLRKRGEHSASSGALEVCLRSTLKMYAFVLCNVLTSAAPPAEEEEGGMPSSSRANRKRRRRDTDAGFGDDSSGVDMDGRELALMSLVELCSPEVVVLWPGEHLEESTLNLILKTTLHMITQKSNIGADAQSISAALALLLSRVTSSLLERNGALDAADLVSPMVELSLKSECAALFLVKLVCDAEQEESASLHSEQLIHALFTGMAQAASTDASVDGAGAKNVALFFGEVSRKCVSVTVKLSEIILPIMESENYDIRKAVITCLAEMIVQRYTSLTRSAADDAIRNRYLNEMLFRLMDINPFVRNHTLHTWERLVDARAVPKRYHLALTAAVVGRLEDRNYLVRDAAMTVITAILRKNWFGQVLNAALIQEKLKEGLSEGLSAFPSGDVFQHSLGVARLQFQPTSESTDDPLSAAEEAAEEAEFQLSEEQTALVNKVLFYESAAAFVDLIQKALRYAYILLDSKTERDVVEAIRLIVACSEYRFEGGEKAFLKVLVMVFEGEPKIQFAVRDAFVEVVFSTVYRLSSSAVTRATASAEKLISLLRYASEGEMSAVDRVLGLLKVNPAYSRHISAQFMDAVWGIAEGTVDQEASLDDRRTAVRIYSLLSKHNWKDVRQRKESILEFMGSHSIKDNILLGYVFNVLQNESLDPQFRPIPASVSPLEHPVLNHIVTHLCRSTTAIASWMSLAEAAINAIHHLCEVPVTVYGYVLDYLGRCEEAQRDANTTAQLFFTVGHTALKQLVAVETAERQQLKALEETPKQVAQGGAAAVTASGTDSMRKELGLDSQEFKRHAVQELALKRKQAILAEGSLWYRFADTVAAACRSPSPDRPFERVCAVMALCQLMIVSDEYCTRHLDLLFSIVSNKRESWVVKTNVVIALGDLACVHPNLLGPYLSVPSAGFFKLLLDDDLRVRAVTIQVCSHLVLGEMLRVRDHLYTIVKLVADPDPTIAANAVTFVQNLAMKEKEKTGNLIPPLVTQLSGVMPVEKFQLAMKTLLERVEGDKPTESLIERLCQRFDTYSERSKKKQQLAQNLAFCLSELNYTPERAVKRILSESCYQQYRHWLRCPEVLDYFRTIAGRAKRQGRSAGERRDRTVIEEWEARMMADSCTQTAEDDEAQLGASAVTARDAAEGEDTSAG